MNAVRSNNVSLKYERFTSSGYKVIGFTKIEFVAKSQFLCCCNQKDPLGKCMDVNPKPAAGGV